MNWEPLVNAALAAREHAYAPYSGFKVGAALLAEDGTIQAGCNIENRSFGATVCAERVAIGSLVASGQTTVTAIVVMSESDPPASPCGMCLQVLTEFATPEVPVLLLNPQGDRREYRLADLSPHPFQLPSQGLGRLSS